MMMSGEHTCRSIGIHLGISRQLVFTILKKHGITRRGHRNRTERSKKELDSRIADIAKDFENGKSTAKLASEFGFDSKKIASALKKYGIMAAGETCRRGRFGSRYSEAVRLLRSGLSDKDVALKLGITQTHAYVIRRNYCPETLCGIFTEEKSVLMSIPYHRRATGHLMNVGMNYLSELVVRPSMKKHMRPLCLYRGSMYPERALRYWNFALLMYAAEAATLADGLKLQNNPSFAQLCGPSKPLSKRTLHSFYGRLWDNPEVTNNIKGFGEYVKSLELGPSFLTQVDVESDRKFVPPWRVSTHLDFDAQAIKPETGTKVLFYPFLVHDPKTADGHDLVLLANKVVPEGLPHDIRADVCQELILSILDGKIKKENARDFVKKHIGKVFRSVAFKYEPSGGLKMSFDAPLPGTEDLNLHEIISDGSYTHWADQMEEPNGEH